MVQGEEDVFWLLVALVEKVLPDSYYSNELMGVTTDVEVRRWRIAHTHWSLARCIIMILGLLRLAACAWIHQKYFVCMHIYIYIYIIGHICTHKRK